MTPSHSLSRRDAMRLGSVALAGVAASGLTGCAPAATHSQLIHGATGGGLKDTLDPHFPVTYPDIARCRQLYEPLLRYNRDFQVEPSLAELVEPNADATAWTFRLRSGLRFHDGQPVRATDVRASMHRMMDKKNPAPYAAVVAPLADLDSSRILDDRTFRLQLKEPYAILDQVMASYSLGIIPENFDLASPVGTGPWKAKLFVPGHRSSFARNDDYWGPMAAFEELVIIDFADDAAKVNALLAGQVHTVDNLPGYLAGAIDRQGARTLVSESGGWIPFVMRVDTPPFNDPRVRQAIRLIPDRQQLIDQALNGFGRLANDLYSPFDPDYLGNDLPQRNQDIDKARSLLKAAGHEGLQVTVVTSTAVGSGGVAAANLLAEQAKKAGIEIRVNKVDGGIFYGAQYLQWPFAQDFWATRQYLPQVSACALPSSPYNSTHWNDERFNGLVTAAQRELNPIRRRTLSQDAQRLEHEFGGFLIWAFQNQVDAYSESVTGLLPDRDQPVSAFRFNLVKPVEGH